MKWLTTSMVMLAMACGDSGGGATGSFELSFAGLEPLGDGFVYEGWILVDGAPVSTGRFSLGDDGMPVEAGLELERDEVERATAFVLTIEPAAGDDPAPSDVHVLGGDLVDGTASLSIGHATALGTDFADAAGEFLLETPTSAAEDDANQGIWWLVPGAAGMEPGLALPALPAGWTYEGWVVGADGPVSTGTFDAADAADTDGAGPTAGTDGGSPPFPGQDFITPPVSLIGHAAVISVEPVPDDSPAPFALKPLMTMSIADVAAPMTQPMANRAAMNPDGLATFL